MKRKGFILIELMIIITIFGILGSILLPMLQMNWSKGKDLTAPINFHVEEQSYSYHVGMELKLKDPENRQKVGMEKLKEKVEKAVRLAVKEVLEVKAEGKGATPPAKAEKPKG